ncbi:trigger factor [Rhodopila globiformis]|uniref:Trigger factor n=1 Tax=Rhodopila globiformis TaxID=1071 RepID=A0A2S6NJP2_RHOGL|nr:trigger factor [Rhodopila globiformis]PPQ35122.1 trigger factor [Rhodopila globiformis]
MQVTETLSDGLKRGYTVVLPVADLDARRTERLASISKSVRLPGFRPGKVPMPIIRQRFGKDVSAEVLQESVNEATQQVLSERGLRPVRTPKVDMVTENPIALATDLEFKLEMELMPDVTMPDFSTIQLTRYKAEMPSDAVDKALQQIAKYNRTLEPLSAETLEARGNGAVTGEIVTIDFEGKIDGVPFEGGKGTDMQVELGGDGFIPGFAEQLEGARPGEARVLNVTFPENYGKADLAGKPATFDVTVKQVSSQAIPAIDDELAKKVGAGTLDAVKEIIVARQREEIDSASRLRLKKELLDALAGMVSFPVPDSLANQEFDQIWRQFEQARKAGTEDEDDKNKDEETLKAEYRAIAERRIRLGLLLAEIARQNNIAVTEQEVTRGIIQRAMQYPGQESQMMELYRKYPHLTDSVRGPLLEDKTVDFILELAKVTDATVTMEELMQEPPEAPKTESSAA